MPHGLGYAHPVNYGESSKGLGIDPVSAQHPQASVETPEAAHSSQTGNSDRRGFRPPLAIRYLCGNRRMRMRRIRSQ